MRTMWILGFQDPDRFYVEVIWRKPDVPDSEDSRSGALDDRRIQLIYAADRRCQRVDAR